MGPVLDLGGAGVLVFLGVTMTLFGQRPFEQIRLAVERAAAADGASADAAVAERRLAHTFRSFHPLLLTLIGGMGLVVLLWLMMFKPF